MTDDEKIVAVTDALTGVETTTKDDEAWGAKMWGSFDGDQVRGTGKAVTTTIAVNAAYHPIRRFQRITIHPDGTVVGVLR